ncbi:hypothetical protein [Piscinibacter sp. XHJ-5]|uniref:hypothetical protein n=1 Tax=Piscinibacter sp. XHJ-5 TaxID=3037797 RepID=UPI0024536963|nr:hypothetical protein [Piscinibacter sp. XHJ-5]
MSHSTLATPLDPSLEMERNAYNAAFYELGLRFYWDSDTFAALQADPDPHERLRRYIETQQPHLLRAYDPTFLVQAIESREAELLRTRGTLSFDWAQACAAEVGA